MNGPRCHVIEVEHLERTLALLHSTGYGEVCRDMPCYIPAKSTRSPAAARLELWFADQSSPKVFSAILKFKIWVIGENLNWNGSAWSWPSLSFGIMQNQTQFICWMNLDGLPSLISSFVSHLMLCHRCATSGAAELKKQLPNGNPPGEISKERAPERRRFRGL